MRKEKLLLMRPFTGSLFLLALFISTKTTAQSITYKPKVDFATGATPFSVAISDLDGDAKPDMIITNSGSNTISVFRNTSVTESINSSSFGNKVDFATGANPTIVTVADLDGDGKQDLIVPNRSSGTISVLRNTSSPGTLNSSSFAAKIDFSTGTGALSVAVGDLDGDGKKDLAVANYNSGTISILRNTSTVGSINSSSFADRVDFATGYSSSIVAVGDIDGDSKPDLAVSIFESNILSFLRNTSTTGNINVSSFAAKADFSTNANPYHVAINDLNGDGKRDVVISNVSTSNVSVFQNTSTSGMIDQSSFAAKVDFGTGQHPVIFGIGDLNKDNKPDLLSANQLSNNITVLQNTSTSQNIGPTFFQSRPDLTTGNEPTSVAIGDFDGDGTSEIAATNLNSNTISVFQGKITLPPTTQWAKHPDGSLAPYSYPTISSDNDGNVYVTGSFVGSLTFATLPSPTTLTSAGEGDIFVVKYNANGTVVWAKRFGDIHGDGANAIKYDGRGNIYIGGCYTENTTFETTSLPGDPGSVNIYLAKINAVTGSLAWVKRGTSSNSFDKSIRSIAIDGNGNAYVTGDFFKVVTFSPLEPMNSGDWWDIFVVKYDPDGVPQWQTKAGSAEPGYSAECGNGIAVDQNGNVFITGKFNGSSANPTHFGNINLVSNGGGGYYETDYFLAKYNQSTSLWEWAVNGGGTMSSPYSTDYGKNISLDNSGALYVSGVLNSETSSFGGISITEQGGKGYFIAKYSNNGNLAWVNPVEGVGYFAGNASKVDANGNFYFAGTFGGTITVGDQTLTSEGYDNTYVSGWNATGDFLWVKQIPGNYYSHMNGLDVESNGNLDVVTVLSGTETFDCTTLNSGGFWDLGVAKLGYTNGSSAPTLQASANNICSGNSTTLSITNANLNDATDWKWYTGNCGGTFIGSGSSIIVSPSQNTTYYVRSEGGCAGAGNCGSISIVVNNTIPVITAVTAPLAPVPVNTSINLSVSTNSNTIASAKIKWSDGSADQIVNNPSANFTVPHTYTSPGVYTVTTTITDACGNASASYQYQYIVVYDPSAGFVTGGGWINSPAGAYRPDTSLNGKAIFGFESRYQNGTTVPSGNTEFKFQVANINFKSSNYEWLVVAGSRAQFKGSGKINGSGNYGFILNAVDGDLKTTPSVDLFRIKIWDINTSAVAYDNQYGTSDDGPLTTQIGGGSVVIHTNKTNNAVIVRDNTLNTTMTENKLQITALPNPTRNYFSIILKGSNEERISIKVLDVLGRVVEAKNNISTNKILTLGENYKPGTYLIDVIQGTVHQTQTVIKQ